MKKILLILIMSMFLISLVSSAEECSIPSVKQGDTIQLTTVCRGGCTGVNLTKVMFPNQSIALLGEFPMTANGSNYNFTFSNTNTLGHYSYDAEGVDPNSIVVGQTCSFLVTPSGNSGNANIVFFIFIIFLLYGINLIGFLKENVMMTVLGGMTLMFLGVYMVTNGIIIYRDNLTNYVSYVTIAWGGMSSVFALFKEYFDD